MAAAIPVVVLFYDHVEDGESPMLITAYGELEKEERDFIILNGWVGGDSSQHNNKRFCIVRSCILSIRELHEGKTRKARI